MEERSKLCRSCGETKLFSEYNKCKSNSHGIQSRCKLCLAKVREDRKEYNKEYLKNYYAENSELLKQRAKNYAEDNKEAVGETRKKYREVNKDYISQWKSAYHKRNKKYVKAKNKEWLRNNPEKHLAHCAKRRAAKIKRTPSWLTDQALSDIADFYYLAKSLTEASGIKYVVDHIIPLQGTNVSGLHVPSNLQILTESENSSKQHKFDIEEFNRGYT